MIFKFKPYQPISTFDCYVTVQADGGGAGGGRPVDHAPPSVGSEGLLAHRGRLSGEGDLPKVRASLRGKVGQRGAGAEV